MKKYSKSLRERTIYDELINRLNNLNQRDYESLIVRTGDVDFYNEVCKSYLKSNEEANILQEHYIQYRNEMTDYESPKMNLELLLNYLSIVKKQHGAIIDPTLDINRLWEFINTKHDLLDN